MPERTAFKKLKERYTLHNINLVKYLISQIAMLQQYFLNEEEKSSRRSLFIGAGFYSHESGLLKQVTIFKNIYSLSRLHVFSKIVSYFSQSLIFWDLNLINWSLQNHGPENKKVITLVLSNLAKASQMKDGDIRHQTMTILWRHYAPQNPINVLCSGCVLTKQGSDYDLAFYVGLQRKERTRNVDLNFLSSYVNYILHC